MIDISTPLFLVELLKSSFLSSDCFLILTNIDRCVDFWYSRINVGLCFMFKLSESQTGILVLAQLVIRRLLTFNFTKIAKKSAFRAYGTGSFQSTQSQHQLDFFFGKGGSALTFCMVSCYGLL